MNIPLSVTLNNMKTRNNKIQKPLTLQIPMTATYNLPDGPQMPRWLRMIKFINYALSLIILATFLGDAINRVSTSLTQTLV